MANNNSSVLISILMPVKNAAKYLEACLLSIIQQEFKHWELIAIDDHSSDSSFSILSQFTKDSRIHVYRATGNGIIDALNQSFELSTGDYIHRMDADDLMPIAKLKELYFLMDGHQNRVVTGMVEYFSDKPVSSGYKDYEEWINLIEDYSAEVYRECTIASPNWLVSRNCFESEIQFKNLNYPEDYDLVLNWYKKGYEVVKSKEITHLWREHSERTSRNSEIYQQASFFRLKLRHFIENEVNQGDKIQLIGAGEKGKVVRKLLDERKVDFEWFDFRKDKVASSDRLKELQHLKPSGKSILTNWPKSEQQRDDIKQFMIGNGFVFGKNVWIF